MKYCILYQHLLYGSVFKNHSGKVMYATQYYLLHTTNAITAYRKCLPLIRSDYTCSTKLTFKRVDSWLLNII